MNEIKLRDYQNPQVNKLIRQLSNHNEAALVSAQGSGKTLIASIVGDKLIKEKIVSKVIVASPFNIIVKEFPSYKGNKILSKNKNNQQFLIGDIRQSQNIKNLVEIITGASSEFLSTSHQAMANSKVRRAVNKMNDCSNTLLIVDEAHHCFNSDEEDDKDGTLLGDVANKIKEKGGKILYVTATPYRTFNRKTSLIFEPSDCNPVIRTIGEHMRDGYAPAMETEYVHIKNFMLTNAGDAGMFGDLKNTKIQNRQVEILLPKVIKQWRKEKYPKTILIIPAGNSEGIAKEVKKYIEQINFPSDVAKLRKRKHPSVLIAVGPSNTVIEYDGKEMSEIEYDKKLNGRAYDIVIGCRKFDEGTDIPSASHIFMVGLPSSVRLFHQRTGRVLRDKKGTGRNDSDEISALYSDWFGDQWSTKSKVVFFAPIGRKTKEFDYKVGRQLLHCIFAAESYQEYCESMNASQNIRIEFQRKLDKTRSKENKELIEELMSRCSDVELSEMKDYHGIEYDEIVSETLNPNETFGDRLKRIKNSDLSPKERTIELNNLMNHLPPDVKKGLDWEKMISAIIKACKKTSGGEHRFDVNPVGIISSELEEVISEFCDEKIISNSKDGVMKVYSDITGETFKDWAEKCIPFLGEEGGLALVKEIIDFTLINGRTPSEKSKDAIERKLGKKLSRLKQAKQGKGHIKFYSSYQVLAEKHGLSDLFEIVNLKEEGLIWVKKIIDFTLKNKRPPSQAFEGLEKQLAEKLSGLIQGKRGRGDSVFYPEYQALAEKYGLPDLFDDLKEKGVKVVKEIIDFTLKNKRPPSSISKDAVEKKLGSKLSCLKQAKQGRGGKFYSEYQALAEKHGLPDLFDTQKEKGLRWVKTIIDFTLKNKRIPSYTPTSKDLEKKLAKKLCSLKRAKQGKGGGKFYPEYQELADEAGLPDLFKIKK